jgi:DEAD/DEAH box helicase domain-containing protein
VATSRERAQAGVTAAIPSDLHPALIEALSAAGIEALWSHQADALEAARRGHTIVSTGSASG